MVIPYDPNTMSYPVSVQQAEQSAREWAQDPNLNFILDGIWIEEDDPILHHRYQLTTLNSSQRFHVDCQTGAILLWDDLPALTAWKAKRGWPETTKLPAATLIATARQFLANRYPNFTSLNMQASPVLPLVFDNLYFQRFANGTWYSGNGARCILDPWDGIAVKYLAEQAAQPTVSTDPTIPSATAEQTALSHCMGIEIQTPDGSASPQSGLVLNNLGAWIENDSAGGTQHLAWCIVIITSQQQSLTRANYVGTPEKERYSIGPHYLVRVDATNGMILETSGGHVISFGSVSPLIVRPEGGVFQNLQNVALWCSDYGVTVRYTTDGSDPTESSAIYVEPITVDHSLTIKVKAWKTNWTASEIGVATYELKLPALTFAPDAGTYQGTQNVTVACAISGATIRYTTDGSDPTESSTEYTGPVAISQTSTLKAKAWKTGWTPSDIKTVIPPAGHS